MLRLFTPTKPEYSYRKESTNLLGTFILVSTQGGQPSHTLPYTKETAHLVDSSTEASTPTQHSRI
jgi:hypothetical protein